LRYWNEPGLANVAAAYRIRLCSILRTFSRFSEAVKSLPPEDGLPGHLRRNLLAVTVELAILAEAGTVALEHSQTLMLLWKDETVECAVETAEAESLLSRAYLACTKQEEAETHAEAAFAVLDPSGHPETARCLLMIASARHAAGGRLAFSGARSGSRSHRGCGADARGWEEPVAGVGEAEGGARERGAGGVGG
jgi:hypothetical protein